MCYYLKVVVVVHFNAIFYILKLHAINLVDEIHVNTESLLTVNYEKAN